MFIRIRKERFGYVLFERGTRDLHFVETEQKLELLQMAQLRKFLRQYYSSIPDDFRYEFIQPPVHQLELAAPIGMYLEITRHCNLDCRHCYKPDDPGASLMKLDVMKRLIQELHDIGVFEIRLCGNEPTCSPHFRSICEFISRLDLFLGVNTNGYFGSNIQDELISLNPDFVVLSIDGDEKSHDEIRGRGSYRKVLELLRRLSKTELRRRINAVVSTVTLSTIEHTAWLANEYGADVSFLPFRAVRKT